METNYTHLSCEERTMIQLSLERGCTLRAIARSMQRAPSTISRELKRQPRACEDEGVRWWLAGIARPLRSNVRMRWHSARDARRA